MQIAPESQSPAMPTELANRFRSTLERLSAYAADEGIQAPPYQSGGLQLFKDLPVDLAATVTDSLDEYLASMSTLKEQGELLRYNLNSVWLTVRKLNWRASTGFFESLEPEDVVEIYNFRGIQLFRSFHFFQHSSYDLETLFSRPWYELFTRVENEEYNELFARLVRGEVQGTEMLSIPAHTVTEAFGMHTRWIKPKMVSILTDRSGKREGYAHVFRFLDGAPTTGNA